ERDDGLKAIVPFPTPPLRCCRANAERTDQAMSRNPAAHGMRRDHVAEGIRSRRPDRVAELHAARIHPSPRAREVRRRPGYRWLVERWYWQWIRAIRLKRVARPPRVARARPRN